MKQHKRIWLQTEHEATGEMTWCEDKINDDDVEYVRGDLFAQLEAENEAWFELCRFFVGGSDEHILIMRNTYLLTAEEEEDE